MAFNYDQLEKAIKLMGSLHVLNIDRSAIVIDQFAKFFPAISDTICRFFSQLIFTNFCLISEKYNL